jgi:hypothetical protein
MALSLPLVATVPVDMLVAEVFFSGPLAAAVAVSQVRGNKINPLILPNLPSPPLAPPSTSCLQDPDCFDPLPPTPTSASPPVQAAIRIPDPVYKQLS